MSEIASAPIAPAAPENAPAGNVAHSAPAPTALDTLKSDARFLQRFLAKDPDAVATWESAKALELANPPGESIPPISHQEGDESERRAPPSVPAIPSADFAHLDAIFHPPASPNEYQLPAIGLSIEEHMLAQRWLHNTALDRRNGEAIAEMVAKMPDEAPTGAAETLVEIECATKLRDIFGDRALPVLDAWELYEAKVSAANPELWAWAEQRGIFNHVGVMSLWMEAAFRIYGKRAGS